MTIYSDKEILTAAKLIAKEALKLDSICRSESADDEEKERQLRKVAALAGTVCGCDTEYNPNDEDPSFK